MCLREGWIVPGSPLLVLFPSTEDMSRTFLLCSGEGGAGGDVEKVGQEAAVGWDIKLAGALKDAKRPRRVLALKSLRGCGRVTGKT